MLFSPRIRTKQLAQLCRRVGLALGAGIEIRRVWQRESESGSPRHRHLMDQIREEVANGATVSDAVEQTNDYFPELAREMIDVGEKTGKLSETFIKLAEHYEHHVALQRIFVTGIIWPAIQFGMAIGIVALLIFIGGFLESGDILGIGLSGVSGAVTFLLIVAALVVGVYFLFRSLSSGGLAQPLAAIVLRLPGIGVSLRTMAMARMAWSLALVDESGMDAKRGVTMALKSTKNPYYSAHIDDVAEQIGRGSEINEALRGTGAFDVTFLDTVEVGEKSGRLAESMSNLSQQLQSQAKTAATALTVSATVLVWMMVALVIIVLIFRIALHIRGTYESLLEM